MDLKDSSFFQKVANSWFASRQRIAEMLCGNVLLMLKGHSSHKGPLGKNKGRGDRGQRRFAAQTPVKRFSPSSQVHLERIEKEIRWRKWESWRKKKKKVKQSLERLRKLISKKLKIQKSLRVAVLKQSDTKQTFQSFCPILKTTIAVDNFELMKFKKWTVKTFLDKNKQTQREHSGENRSIKEKETQRRWVKNSEAKF